MVQTSQTRLVSIPLHDRVYLQIDEVVKVSASRIEAAVKLNNAERRCSSDFKSGDDAADRAFTLQQNAVKLHVAKLMRHAGITQVGH
jgi:hypothetical protein